jgi:hypothetical protein
VDAMSETYWVTTQTNLRAGPSTDFDRVGGLGAGTEITVTGKVRDKNWYRVALAGGAIGYIYGGLIEQVSPTPATPIAGTPHDTFPNVVWDANGQFEPASGYSWASDDPNDYDVVWDGGWSGNPAPGTYHDTYPNVVWNADGLLDPAAGYRWANDDPDSCDVLRVTAGTPHDTHPNVVWDEDGQLQPASEFQWLSDDPDSYDVMRVYAGTPHYKYPNVVWDSDGQLEPASRYAWVTDDPDDYRVRPN